MKRSVQASQAHDLLAPDLGRDLDTLDLNQAKALLLKFIRCYWTSDGATILSNVPFSGGHTAPRWCGDHAIIPVVWRPPRLIRSNFDGCRPAAWPQSQERRRVNAGDRLGYSPMNGLYIRDLRATRLPFEIEDLALEEHESRQSHLLAGDGEATDANNVTAFAANGSGLERSSA